MSAGTEIGIRMHWLLRDEGTSRVLEEAGYPYDASAGYNETVGYRNGTSQVFMPLDCRTLLELPTTYPGRSPVPPSTFESVGSGGMGPVRILFIQHASATEGVLTILWHDRSHAAERFWGDFYIQLVQRLKVLNVWFATASQVVRWFRRRRTLIFRRDDGECADTWLEALGYRDSREPLMTVRIHVPGNSGAACT